jgi:hypothetical protein
MKQRKIKRVTWASASSPSLRTSCPRGNLECGNPFSLSTADSLPSNFQAEPESCVHPGLLFFTFAAVLLLSLFASGCATEVGHHTALGQTYPPKPESYPVAVFTNGLPAKAFKRMAILDAHCESQGFLPPNLEHDALPMLIKQARTAGCDAIIEIQEMKLQANWTLETRIKHFTAVGIIFE